MASVKENPIAWILAVLLAIAEHGNYQRGRERDRLCQVSGLLDKELRLTIAARNEIGRICADPDDYPNPDD